MKKRLLLSLTALVALTASAQNEVNSAYTPADFNSVSSSFKDVESKNVSNNKSVTNITNDTVAVTYAKWGMAQSSAQSFKLAAYPTQDPNNQGGVDVLGASQNFPMVGTMDVTSVGLLVGGNSSITPGTGNADVYVLDKTGMIGSATFSASSVGYVWVDFATPATVTDTFTILVQPKAAEDTLTFIFNGDVSSLGVNSYSGALNVLSLDAQGGLVSNNNYGLIQGDADWIIMPVVSHSINTVATPDVPCLTSNNLDVIFDFESADTSIIMNPFFNVNAFMIQHAAQSKAENRFYATAKFDTTDMTLTDTLDLVTFGSEFMFNHTYASTGTKNVEITQNYKSWGYLGGTVNFTSTSEVTLACASLDENSANAFTLFPNPANDVVTVSLANASNGNITLLSADGKIVESRKISSSLEVFNVKALHSGVYFFQVGENIQKLMVK